MTADQMVSALLYHGDSDTTFNLASAIDGLIEILRSHGFGEIDRTLVLRFLLAATGADIYGTDWKRLAGARRNTLLESLSSALPRASTALEGAIWFLKERVGVGTARLLPYGMQLTVLASFFYAQPAPSTQQLNLLEHWFWVSSFATWFGGANPSRVNGLVRDVMDNMAPEQESPQLTTIDLMQPAAPLPKSFDMRSARTRVLLLALFSLKPRNRDGKIIENVDELVRLYGPDALGHVVSRSSDRDLARSPGNRILRDQPEDRGQARNWLLGVPDEIREEVWMSHAVPADAAALLQEADGAAFLAERVRTLTALEHQFMRDRGVVLPLSDAPAPAAPDSAVSFDYDD